VEGRETVYRRGDALTACDRAALWMFLCVYVRMKSYKFVGGRRCNKVRSISAPHHAAFIVGVDRWDFVALLGRPICL
jgi:hypothetical protein